MHFSPRYLSENSVRLSLGVVGLAAFLTLGGCGGSSEPFSLVKTHGKVTYADGSLIPAERIKLIFISETPPIDPKTFPRPGNAEVNVADGTFDTITTHYAGDGLVAGKHKVQVMTMDKNDQPTRLVPPKYGDPKQTPLEIDTASGEIKILVEKPKPGETTAPVGGPNPYGTPMRRPQ